jgi:hypothetical protein
MSEGRIGKVQGRADNANVGDRSGAIDSYRKGLSLLEPIALASVDTKLQSDINRLPSKESQARCNYAARGRILLYS